MALSLDPSFGSTLSLQDPGTVASALSAVPAQAPAQAPASPFIWGQGGQMLLPDQIARRQQMATAEEQAGMDYSPVRSWTEGLARVAQGLVGTIDQRRLDKQESAQAAYGQQVAQALMGGGASGGDPSAQYTAIAVNPFVPQAVKDMAKFRAEKSYEQQEKQPEPVQLARIANDPTQPAAQRQAAADHLRVINDPMVNTTIPGLGVYSGPKSGYDAALAAAGARTLAAPHVPPPEAIAELHADPSPQAQAEFDQAFGSGASARYLGGPQVAPAAGFPDPMKAPGHMTSGRRTVEGNRLVGGVPTSHHIDGDAADYTGASLQQLEAYFGPSARYLDEGNHIHVTLPGYHRMPYLGGLGSTGAR